MFPIGKLRFYDARFLHIAHQSLGKPVAVNDVTLNGRRGNARFRTDYACDFNFSSVFGGKSFKFCRVFRLFIISV